MWREDEIGNVAKTYAGGTPSRSVESFYKGDIPWVKSTEVNQKYIKNTEEFISQEALSKSSAKHIPKKTPLIAMYGATAGQVSFLEIDATANQAVLALIPDEINSKFLFYVLSSLKEKIVFLAQGSGQPNLSKSLVDKQKIRFPEDIMEQNKIVSILERIDQAIEKTEELIAKYEQIKQGMMHDLFTRGVDENGELRPSYEDAPELYRETEIGFIPKDWDVMPLKEMYRDLIDYRGKPPPKSDYGVPLITAKNVRFGFINPEPQEFIPENSFVQWMNRGIPEEGDVTFTMEAPLGNVAQIPDYKLALGQRTVTFCPNKEVVGQSFLKWLLMSPDAQRRIHQKESGSTAKGIQSKTLINMSFPMPQTGEQKNISNSLDGVESYINSLIEETEKLRKQKAGLMQDLLTGKVSVNVEQREAA